MNATELRALLEAAGLSQRGAARALEIDERTIRRYCAGELQTPRVVVLAIERLRDLRNTSVDAAERPLSESDVGKLIVGEDRYGAGIYGRLIKDAFGLVIREIHPQAVDARDLPVDRVCVYTLLDPRAPEGNSGQYEST